MMWDFANKLVKTVSDMTVGTVIVLVHVALAEREHERRLAKQRVRYLGPN
jgi:hypothetical protein